MTHHHPARDEVAPVVHLIIRDVAELPDRTSPDDQPDMMLVTAEELKMILQERLSALSVPDAGVREALEEIANFTVDGNAAYAFYDVRRIAKAALSTAPASPKYKAGGEVKVNGASGIKCPEAIADVPGGDDDEPAEWAIEAERSATEAYASYMGDPDGENTHAARMAAAQAIEQHARKALSPSPAPEAGLTFQSGVAKWMAACFGPAISGDKVEQNHRFLEEALELVQALGCTADEAHQLVDYTFGRPVGYAPQEVGGVMVTLAALCLANEMHMDALGDAELARVWTKVDQIREKQRRKPQFGPLPGSYPDRAALSKHSGGER